VRSATLCICQFEHGGDFGRYSKPPHSPPRRSARLLGMRADLQKHVRMKEALSGLLCMIAAPIVLAMAILVGDCSPAWSILIAAAVFASGGYFFWKGLWHRG
jgi:hypothetical protein